MGRRSQRCHNIKVDEKREDFFRSLPSPPATGRSLASLEQFSGHRFPELSSDPTFIDDDVGLAVPARLREEDDVYCLLKAHDVCTARVLALVIRRLISSHLVMCSLGHPL